jgi:multidrug efflux pump subunit AcrA (membrane-fusion protein)
VIDARRVDADRAIQRKLLPPFRLPPVLSGNIVRDLVKKGQTIAKLQDNDPELVQRYQRELEAAKSATQSAALMFETSKINLQRQRSLFDQGLSARKEYLIVKNEAEKYA